MTAESLLANRKASQVFFSLVGRGATVERVAKACSLTRAEARGLLERMQDSGLVRVRGKCFGIDWDQFLPIFLRQAMNIYSAAMPWKFIPRYIESGEQDFIEAACAHAERELARVKMRLAGNDDFCHLIQTYFHILATETIAPDDYFDDLRLSDVVGEFEYALLKMASRMRAGERGGKQARELHRLLREWVRQIRTYDTPTGAALRAAFRESGLLPVE